MIKVAVTGAAGRMGSGIIRKISEQSDMEVVAAIEMPNTPLAGKDAGRPENMKKAGSLLREFQAQNQAVTCRELKGIGTGVVLRECNDCVRDAAEMLERYL